MFIRVFFIPNYHKSKGNHDVPIYLPLSIAEKRCKYYFLPNLYYVYAPYNCDGDVVAWLRRSYTSAVRKSLAKSPCPPLLCTGITKNASSFLYCIFAIYKDIHFTIVCFTYFPNTALVDI